MGMCGGSNKDAAQAQADEAARQARIKEGTAAIDKVFAEFDDGFFDRRAKEYFDFALPTLNLESARTRGNLAFDLANRGLLRSSVRNQREQSLANEVDKQKRIIGDAGLSQANALRASVEDARGRVYNQLLASADPANATAAATRAASDLKTPSPVGPIGNFFSDWSSIYLANKSAREENPNTQPLFGWGGGSGSSSKLVK